MYYTLFDRYGHLLHEFALDLHIRKRDEGASDKIADLGPAKMYTSKTIFIDLTPGEIRPRIQLFSILLLFLVVR